MKVEDVKTVSIIGAGLMGHGIAQVFAQAGYNVLLRDIKQEFLLNGVSKMKENLQKLSAAGLVRKEEIDATISRVKTTLDMQEALTNSDFMIEAATENIDLKKQIFREASNSPPNALFWRPTLPACQSLISLESQTGLARLLGRISGTRRTYSAPWKSSKEPARQMRPSK